MIKIETLQRKKKTGIQQACDLCNELAALNKSKCQPFVVIDGHTLGLEKNMYANPDITRGIYAVFYIIDHIAVEVAYTRIGYGDSPLSIRIDNLVVFNELIQRA